MTDFENSYLIESLLYQSEGTALDFKEKQYLSSGADERKKSELLKDILAFANSWRQTDAHILIGVKDIDGGRAEVKGCEDHPDDAQLQQFINSKTNKTIVFSYRVCEFEDKKIGIITIPLQERPIYSNKNYGVVKKGEVYYRLGSSTTIAKPEDIAKMGRDFEKSSSPEPLLNLEFADLVEHLPRSCSIQLNSIVYAKTSYPLSDLKQPRSNDPYGIASHVLDSPNNPEYWRECEEYLRKIGLVNPVGFIIANNSDVLAADVRLEIQGNLDDITVFDVDSVPETPIKSGLLISRNIRSAWHQDTKSKVNIYGSKWVISVECGNIQPQQIFWAADPVYIGCQKESRLELEASIYANNLSEPRKQTLIINFQVENKPEFNIDSLPSDDSIFSGFEKDITIR